MLLLYSGAWFSVGGICFYLLFFHIYEYTNICNFDCIVHFVYFKMIVIYGTHFEFVCIPHTQTLYTSTLISTQIICTLCNLVPKLYHYDFLGIVKSELAVKKSKSACG